MKNRIPRILAITFISIICFICILYFLGTKSEAYRFAVHFIDNNTSIAENIGLLKSRRLAFWGYYVRYNGPHGYAEYRIFITGEKGEGEVYLSLEKTSGEWKVIKGNLILKNGKNIALT